MQTVPHGSSSAHLIITCKLTFIHFAHTVHPILSQLCYSTVTEDVFSTILLSSATKCASLALSTSVQRHGGVESDKIKLSLVLSHQVCYNWFASTFLTVQFLSLADHLYVWRCCPSKHFSCIWRHVYCCKPCPFYWTPLPWYSGGNRIQKHIQKMVW